MRKVNQQQQLQRSSSPSQQQQQQQSQERNQSNISNPNVSTVASSTSQQPQSLLQLMMVNSDSGLSMSSVLPSASSSSSLMASSTNYLPQSQQQQQPERQQQQHLVALHPIHVYPSSSTSSISTLAVAGESHWPTQQPIAVSQQSTLKSGDRNIFVPMPSSASSLSSTSSLLHSGNISSSLITDYDDYGVINHLNSPPNLASANGGGNSSSGSIYNTTGCSIYEIPPVMLSRAMASSSTATAGGPSSIPATAASGSTLYRSGSKTSSSYAATSSLVEPRSEYESLYKRYAELDSFHHEVVKKLSLSQAENIRLRKMYEEILQQLNQTLREKTSLQQQCTAAIRHWDKAIREIHELQDQLAKVKQQRDEANRECNNAMEGRSKAISERKRMYEERNTALHEYNLIMSERDSVHKEIEKLQEDLHELIKRNEILEKEQKITLEERESLRRELASALLDRDQAMKLCTDLREKYGESHSANSSLNSSNLLHQHGQQNSLYSQLPLPQQHSQHSLQHGSANFDYGLFPQITDTHGNACSSSSNSSLLGVSNQTQSPTTQVMNGNTTTVWHSKSRSTAAAAQHISTASSTSSVSTFGMPPVKGHPHLHLHQHQETSAEGGGGQEVNNAEMEMLRKQIERLQLELQDVNQEIEVCKKRRDWAFSERDKIVLERESIRTLCDNLRRERDRNFSDLAEALLESDEIKRQKNEALKELKQLKEKFYSKQKDKDSETSGSGESGATNSNSACVSQDSAIDVEYNYGRPDMDLIELCLKRESKDVDWGFKLCFDEKETTGSQTIVVASVLRNSIAGQSGQLRVYDQMVKINDWQLTDGDPAGQLSKVQSIIADPLQLHLQVRRKHSGARAVHTVSVPLLVSAETAANNRFQENCLQKICGFSLDILLFVKRIHNSKEKLFSIGDRIVSIGGHPLDTILRAKFVELLLKSFETETNTVKVQILKMLPDSVEKVASVSFADSFNSEQRKNLPETINISVIPPSSDSIGTTVETMEYCDTLKRQEELNHTSGTLVESEVDEEDEDRVVVDEDNDADEDEPNSDAEVRTIAELDQVLDKYQVDDFYSSTVTNSSGGSLVAQMSPLSTVPSISLGATATTTTATSSTVDTGNGLPTTTVSKDSVVRRSSRLSKKNRQRCTLAASQLTQELSLALNSSNSNSTSGDTWPRYKPHQLLLTLPSLYKNHAHELYSKQNKRAPLASLEEDKKRRKQRKPLGVFFDIIPKTNLLTSTTTTAVASSSSTTIDTATSSTSSRRSPRVHGQHEDNYGVLKNQSIVAPATAAGTTYYDPRHEVAYGHRHRHLPASIISSVIGSSSPTSDNQQPKSDEHSTLKFAHILNSEKLGHNYNSLKQNSYSFEEGPESNSANMNLYYTAQPSTSPPQPQQQQANSNYSPIYSAYSSFRSQATTGGDSAKESARNSAEGQNDLYLYGGHSIPLVDYSVVSAQSQDKNVLKYYKTRQASGSSQTGVTGGGGGGGSGSASGLSPMFVPYSTAGVSSASSIQSQHLQRTYQTNPSNTSDIYSLSFANDIYGRSKLNADFYSNLSGGNARNSMPVTLSLTNYNLSSGSHMTSSSLLSSSSYPHHHHSQPHPYSTLVSTGNSGVPLNPHNRLSMNLTNLSLLMTSGQQSSSWDNELATYSKKLPEINSNTLISLPSTRSYKDSFSPTYASVYEARERTLPATSQQQYSLLDKLYGKRATPPPATVNHQAYFSPSDDLLSTSFDDTFALKSSNSQRFRIASNSSTSAAKTEKQPSSSATVAAATSIPAYSTTSTILSAPASITTGGITNIIGDRNSCSLFPAGGPPFEVKWIKCSKDGSPGSPILDCRKAKPDDYRLISVERSSALLGIRILRTTKSKGVFVQMVTEGSLAAQAGIKVGDQIIDICGLNMRAADYENAAKVLNQCGDPIQMLVQYNYDKYKEIDMMYGDGQGSDSLCQ